MTSVGIKLKVTAAAIAVGAAGALVPAAAGAAPSVPAPSAPVHHLVGDFAQGPGDRLFIREVRSLQRISFRVTRTTERLDRKITRLEQYAADHPDTFFGQRAAIRAGVLQARYDSYGGLNLSACNNGSGVSVGPYGTFDDNVSC